MIQTLTLDEIYRVFVRTYPLDKLSFTQFKLLKPWNVIKAYRETCLCRLCELFRLYIMGLRVVASILKPLTDVVQNDGQHDEDSTCPEDSPDEDLLSLAKFCSHERKQDMVDRLVCGGRLHSAKIECFNGKCPDCGFSKLWSKGLRPKIVGSDSMLLDGVASVWGHEIRWETLKSSSSTPSGGTDGDGSDTLRAQKRGSVVDFLDAFEAVCAKFPAHRHLVLDAKEKAGQVLRNLWPGMLLGNYDWSENGVITPDRQIQSEYWSLTHYSLFICITSYLLNESWLDCSSTLRTGMEVTVEPEGAPADSLKPAKGSYWAKVHASPGVEGEAEVYSVQREDGTVIGGITRSRLRYRKFHTTAFVCITDEKRHDAATTQHFMNKQFEHWLTHVQTHKFWAWLGHSDNASHFKSSAMLHYWSQKMSQLDFLKACWIDFGCPGHGKGPWDGMGAVMKQQLKRDMTNGKILTASGYVTSPRDVAEHLRARFQTDEWKVAHADKSVNEIVVTYSHHNEMPERPAVEHEYEPLTGKMNSYSYVILARDQIGRRERSCWCEPCFHQQGRATLTPKGNSLICDGCCSPLPLPWHEQTVKDLGTGLAGRRKEAQGIGAQLAPTLKAGGFFAIQAREQWSLQEDVLYRPGHYWVAQAPDVLEVKKIVKRETINGQPFSPGDYMIRIGRYFDRDPSDDRGLTFEEWQPELVFTPDDVSHRPYSTLPHYTAFNDFNQSIGQFIPLASTGWVSAHDLIGWNSKGRAHNARQCLLG